MLITVFRENKAFTVFFVLLISVIYWSISGFNTHIDPGVYHLYHHGIFYLFPGLANAGEHPALGMALNLILILFSGIYLSRLLVKYHLLPKRTLLPMMVFFFISIPWIYRLPGFSFPLLTIPVLIFVTSNLFETAETKVLAYGYFNNALLLGVASFFNHLLLFYILFLVVLYFRLRNNRIKELVFIILGVMLPYAVLFALLYLFNVSIKSFLSSYEVLFDFKRLFPVNTMMLIFLLFNMLLFAVASWQALKEYVKMKILIRKYSISFLLLFLLSLIVIVFFPYHTQESFIFLALPLSFLYGYYFVICRPNMVNQVLFFLFMLSNVALFVQDYFGL